MKWLAAFLFQLPLLSVAQSPKDYKKAGAPIPEFSIVKTDGAKITNALLKKGAPVILMIFSPECDHCARMLDTLKAMSPDFKKTQLLLVTEAHNKQYLKGFITKAEIGKYPAFRHIGWDAGNLIYYLYTYQLLPQVNVYNGSHRLIRTFTGAFPLDSLRQYIQ